jgi:hypothetical protein
VEGLIGPPNISGNLLPLRLLPLEQAVSTPQQLSALLSAYKSSKYVLALQPGEAIPWWDLRERFLAGYRAEPHIAVTLTAGARSKDILTAVLEAGYLRQQLRQQAVVGQRPCACGDDASASSRQSCGCGGGSMQPQRQELQQAAARKQQQQDGGTCKRGGGGSSNGSDGSSSDSGDSSSSASAPLLLPVEELSIHLDADSSVRRSAKRQAERSVGRFLHDLQAGGWQAAPFLLCKQDRVGFIKY